MSRNLFYALALASCLSLVACGGSMSPSPVSNGVPIYEPDDWRYAAQRRRRTIP